jgi:hypothetical protein
MDDEDPAPAGIFARQESCSRITEEQWRWQNRLLISEGCFMKALRVLRYPRWQTFYGLSEGLLYDYIGFFRQSAELVILDC